MRKNGQSNPIPIMKLEMLVNHPYVYGETLIIIICEYFHPSFYFCELKL